MHCSHCGHEVTQQIPIYNSTPNVNGCALTTSQWIAATDPTMCAVQHNFNPVLINCLKITASVPEQR